MTLALGIGANTAMFTVLHAVLLRTLPAYDPQRLAMLSDPESHGIGVGDGSGRRNLYAWSEFEDLRDRNEVFSGICAVDSHVRRLDVAVEGAAATGEPEQADVSLGAQPRDILHTVMRETLLLVMIGVALGLPSILAANVWLSSQLFGLTALDPVAIGVSVLVLGAVTVLAGLHWRITGGTREGDQSVRARGAPTLSEWRVTRQEQEDR